MALWWHEEGAWLRSLGSRSNASHTNLGRDEHIETNNSISRFLGEPGNFGERLPSHDLYECPVAVARTIFETIISTTRCKLKLKTIQNRIRFQYSDAGSALEELFLLKVFVEA